MEWTAAARKPWWTPSRPRSAPTPSSIRSCLPMNNNIRVHLAALEAREWAGTAAGGGHRYPQEERPDGKKILERISKETGGRLFEVSKKQPIDQIYTSIAEELRNQYSIGYTPAPDVAPGYHKIHLTTKQKDMTVQTRDGYYSDR